MTELCEPGKVSFKLNWKFMLIFFKKTILKKIRNYIYISKLYFIQNRLSTFDIQRLINKDDLNDNLEHLERGC